jgi:hypothetical protein
MHFKNLRFLTLFFFFFITLGAIVLPFIRNFIYPSYDLIGCGRLLIRRRMHGDRNCYALVEASPG